MDKEIYFLLDECLDESLIFFGTCKYLVTDIALALHRSLRVHTQVRIKGVPWSGESHHTDMRYPNYNPICANSSGFGRLGSADYLETSKLPKNMAGGALTA